MKPLFLLSSYHNSHFNIIMTDYLIFIIISIVAVHGLGSNPKSTWNSYKHPEETDSQENLVQKHMWLRDRLPNDIPEARVMTFNHNTSWQANALSKSLNQHGRDLLMVLRRARDKPAVSNNSSEIWF